MKKYKLIFLAFILVFSLFSFGASHADADSSGCLTGDLFSRTTGQTCSNNIATACLPGDLYSSLTGRPCIETTNTPFISSISPTYGPIGSSITLIGSGFSSNNSIKFGGGYINGINSNGTVLTFTISTGLGACLPNFSGIVYACPAMGVMITPGDYKISVLNAGGTSNAVSFTVAPNKISTAPVINGVDGPESLNVNQQGTWSVNASDQSNENLYYTVNWGDNLVAYPMSSAYSVAPQQSATFTHTYSSARIFTPTFTVTNANGQSAQTSLSVNVGGVVMPPVPTPLPPVCPAWGCNGPRPIPLSTCVISNTLRLGSTGSDVDCLQERLGLPVDGKFGPKTKAAVTALQSNAGLTVDGVFGPKSISALESENSTTTQ